MTETFCIFIVVVLLIFYIIDFKHGLEHFKSEQIYENKYLNDPNKINQYIKQKEDEESKLKFKVNSLTSINKIQSNLIHSMNIDEIGEVYGSTCKTKLSKNKTYVNNPQLIQSVSSESVKKNFTSRELSKNKKKHSDINNGSIYRNINKSVSEASRNKYNKKNPNLQKVNFSPIINTESKYKLYHNSLFTPNPAPKLYSENKPIIDQTINTNIQNYINKGIQSVPIDYANPSNTSVENIDLTKINMKGKTIKEIYDEITQDSRLDLQKNLDDLQAFNNRNDYMLGEKYGTTRFDTYALA